MHMFGIGFGYREADLVVKIQVDIEVGVDKLDLFDVLEINHIGSVAALNQGSFQLFFKAFHGIPEHYLF